MKKLLLCLLFAPTVLQAQFFGTLSQFFDGNQLPFLTLEILIEDSAQSVWQIGPPNKIIFNSAATLPNAIVTDTANSYPISDSSRFSFGVPDSLFRLFGIGVIAINWKQKIDLEMGIDGGIVEFSIDSGNTYTNAFTSPFVYNFFGYQNPNRDTIITNEIAFTGTDTTWRDIWLCFDAFWLSQQDSLRFRYRLSSDSSQSNQEGWMIDNMSIRPTIIHTINEKERSEYIRLSPNPASEFTAIDLRKQKELHYIKEVRLIDMQGREINAWYMVPNKFKVPLNDLEAGNYFLSVETNLKTEIHQIVVTD